MRSPACPVCKSLTVVCRSQPDLHKCIGCSLIFQYPPPSKSELKKLYSDTDYFSFWGNKRSWSLIDVIKEKTATLLINELIGLNIHTGKLLDVGCARGALLTVAKNKGFTIFGIEPSKESATYAEQKSGGIIYNKLFENIVFEKVLFDVVVFFDYFEHFTNINSVMKKCNDITVKNGYIIISTPNTDSLSFRLLGKSWPHFKQQHIYYFNKKSIRLLLENNGFKIKLMKPSIKVFSLNYIKSYFEVFNTSLFAKFVSSVLSFFPEKLLSLSVTINNGNILVIAQKIAS